jgi:tetratricopeptide (TPR) repeat protein
MARSTVLLSSVQFSSVDLHLLRCYNKFRRNIEVTLVEPGAKMKISYARQYSLSVAIILCLTACSSSEYQSTTQSVPNDKTVATDQALWQKLTASADAAAKQGDKTTAEKGYKDAVVEAEKLGMDTAPQAESLANLANFYYVQGDGAQADGLYRKALAAHEKALGLEHVDLIKDLIGLARVCHSEKKDDEAITCYARAIAISDKAKQPVPADVTAEFDKLQGSQKSATASPPAAATPGSASAKADKTQ